MNIKCPKCSTENTADSQFCKSCAAPLPSSKEISVTETLEAAKEQLTTGSLFAGRYQIIEELGKGGMGKVYRALDKKLDEEVAIKLIKPEVASDKKTIERFNTELKLARKIAHKNVGRMYELMEDKGTHFITMEYVRGQDLRALIRQTGQLTVGTAISIAKQVCEGLTEAHRLGVIHRDIKPQNIMIDKEGNARILDFGIARSLKTKGITDAGVMIGTPEYMSPEQVEGLKADQRSDIYSLGVILYEMVTGAIPFDGETPFSIALKHKSEAPRDPKEVNPQIQGELSRVILKCLEKNREKRYQTSDELLSDLSKIDESIPTSEKVIPKRGTRISREITVTFNMKKILIPAFVIIALAVIAVLIFRPFSKREAVPFPSDKPSLAVMYFKNNTGDESLEHWRSALSDLLITDLSQSKHIRVLSAEKLFNILQQLDQLEASTYSSEVIKEVAARGGVENVLVGNYTRADETFRISVSLQEARSGELIGSESVEGYGEKDFYVMVDELTRKIKASFELSDQQIAADIDKAVGEITTGNPDAYKHYSIGRKHHLSGDYPKSIESMLKAVEIDPEFAMAYRSLAAAYGNMGFLPASKNAHQKAFELRDRVSERERYTIEGDYYRISEKTLDKSIAAYKKLLDLYPGDSIGITNLGTAYIALEEWDKALELFRSELSVKPVNYITYTNVISMYLVKGMYDVARQVLMSALNDYPDNNDLYEQSALIHACQGEYDLALEEVEKSISLSRDVFPYALKGDIFHLKGDYSETVNAHKKLSIFSASGIASSAYIDLSQGKLDSARATLEKIPALQVELVNLYLKTGEFENALEEIDQMLEDAVKNESVSGQILLLHHKGLAQLGLESVADAQGTAEKLRQLIQNNLYKKAIRYYQHLMGMIELEQEYFPKAIGYFQDAISLLPYTRSRIRDYRIWFMNSLAQAYTEAKDLEKAREEYEKITSLTYPRLRDGDIFAKSFYMLGKIYEEQGNTTKSVEHYEKFLSLWKDADPGIAEVEDAKKRLNNLQQK